MRIAESRKWKILKSLEVKPMSATDLMSVLGLGYRAVFKYLAALKAAKRIYVCGHSKANGGLIRVYGLGNKPDVEYVPLKLRHPHRAPLSEQDRLQLAAEALSDKSMTVEELGKALFLCTSRARFYTKELRAANPRQAYIKEWKRSAGKKGWVPVYAAGNHPDAPMPRKTGAQKYRDKIAAPERRERILQKWNERYHAKKKKSQPANWASALGI